MAKNKLSVAAASRISILFFWTLLNGGLLWAERFAHSRRDYIFREMLPWLMPAALAVLTVLFVVLLAVWLKKGKPQSDRLFRIPYLLYLLIAPIAAILFPWLSTFGTGFQLFGLALKLVFCGLIGYFVSFVAYHVARPAAGVLGGLNTLCAVALLYFYQMYLAPSTLILNTPEFGYLPAGVVAAILGGILAVLTVLAICFGFFKRFRCKWTAPFFSGGFTVLLLAVNAILRPYVAAAVMRWTTVGGVVLLAVWFVLFAVSGKKKP